MSTATQIGVVANLIVSLAYLAIAWSVLSPLLRARRRGLNMLGLATAGIFLSCAVHHSGHALAVVAAGRDHAAGGFTAPLVAWDVVTMAVGVYYWTLRRGYAPLVQGGQLFADLQEQRRAAAEQAALRLVATAVAEERPSDEMFGLVAHELRELLDVECALVARFDWTEAVVVGTSGDHGTHLGRRFPLGSAAGLGGVHGTGAAVRVSYDDLADDAVGAEIRAEGYRHGIAAPIMVGSSVWGAALVATTRADGLAGPGLEERVMRFGELVGLGVANADAHARMAEAAAIDMLTGLTNHRVFQERLAAEASRAERHDRPLSLVLLNLDHFSSVNDLHGHQVGDRVLIEVARRLLTMSREEDVVARIGGDEFALLLPDTDELGAYRVAQRARSTISGAPFAVAGHLTLSGGICSLARAGRAHSMARLSGGALYWAKAHGRDSCFIYTPEVVEALSRRGERREDGAHTHPGGPAGPGPGGGRARSLDARPLRARRPARRAPRRRARLDGR